MDLYTADMKTRLKENTWATKDHIIRTKLLPYFGRLKMCNITAQQIITWQNEMLNHKDENGKPYSPVYLKTVHNQLKPLDIVLLHTGAQKNYGRTEYRITGCGVGREATLWLLRQGVKVVGTDAWSWEFLCLWWQRNLPRRRTRPLSGRATWRAWRWSITRWRR